MIQAIISTTEIQQSTCATCPYFSDYSDRGRGLCHIFDEVTRRHWEKSSDCDCAIKALERECRIDAPTVAYPVMVELATRAIEDNGDGYPVPVETVNLLVAVSRLSTEAVIAATVAKGYGEGYRLMNWWRPSEGEEF